MAEVKVQKRRDKIRRGRIEGAKFEEAEAKSQTRMFRRGIGNGRDLEFVTLEKSFKKQTYKMWCFMQSTNPQ